MSPQQIFLLKGGEIQDTKSLNFKWRPFYEAQFGVEIFVEVYESTL